MKNRDMLRILGSFLAVLAIMAMIYSFSAQTADESNITSGAIVQVLVKILYPSLDALPADRQAQILDLWSFAVRKLAHFTEYAVLGAALMLHLEAISRVKAVRHEEGIAFLSGVLYAITDELHQGVVDGRAPAVRDIFIDAAGVLLAVVLLAAILRKRRNT